MHEALYRLIQAHYIEILAILPAVFMMAGLAGTVRIDQYIQKRHRQIMLVICVLVFSLILQNELDYLLTVGQPMIRLRILP